MQGKANGACYSLSLSLCLSVSLSLYLSIYLSIPPLSLILLYDIHILVVLHDLLICDKCTCLGCNNFVYFPQGSSIIILLQFFFIFRLLIEQSNLSCLRFCRFCIHFARRIFQTILCIIARKFSYFADTYGLNTLMILLINCWDIGNKN